MSDLSTQLREYLDATASPIEFDGVVGDAVWVPSRQTSPKRRTTASWAYGIAGVVVPVALILGVALLLPGGNEDEVALQTPPSVPASGLEGTWVATEDDGSTLTATFQLSGDGVVEMLEVDDYASVCSGAPSTMTGTGGLESDTMLVIPEPILTCDDGSRPEALSGPPLEEQLQNLTFTYDPGTDTLTDNFGMVWSREGSEDANDVMRSDPTGGTPFPDTDAAVPGDDGAGPQPLGAVSILPDSVHLDFLFELCSDPNCFRDAHFMDPSGSGLGAGGFEPDTPFHVREGFPVVDAALGEGFDVVIYVTPFESSVDGFVAPGPTVRYTADYIVRGETDACGPDYEWQAGTVVCEWFVHEFEGGLPEGRYAMWAVWEAPCWAWVEYGYVVACTDPGEVMSLFSSGFDGPFEAGVEYESVDGEDPSLFAGLFGDGTAPEPILPVADGSGAAPTAGTPIPEMTEAIVGDPGQVTAQLGQITTLPTAVHLDFLFEICLPEVCFRDAHFMDPDGSGLGSGGYPAGEPFFIREGFPLTGEEPLGEGFDVVVYVTAMADPGHAGGEAIGETVRYTADYIVRGDVAGCGPGYRTQEVPVTCEWFVHEFADGLPAGRHALWVVWEAPCEAWIGFGFVEECADPDEVLSLFQSGFDAPFGDGVSYTDSDQAPMRASSAGG